MSSSAWLITLLPHIPRIVATGRPPIVNACEYVKDPKVTSVYVDNVAAAQEATTYLLTLGHQAVAFIAGMQWSAMVSGVQPPSRWTMRTGRGELNRIISFIRQPKTWPVTPFDASDER